MGTLYSIGEDLRALETLLLEAGGEIENPEAEAALDAWLRELGAARDQKIDNYCRLIRDIEARKAGRKAEADRLRNLVEADAGVLDRLKGRLYWFLQEQEIKKLDTGLFRLSIRANGGQRPLRILEANVNYLPLEFQRRIVEADTAAIRAALENGEPLAFARLEERGSHLRIE